MTENRIQKRHINPSWIRLRIGSSDLGNQLSANLGLKWAAAHLRPKFADNWLPKSLDPILNRIQEGLMCLFCILFSVIAFQVVIETFRDDVQSMVLRVAVWPNRYP